MADKDKKTCFIIMPFGKTKNHSESYWTNHFENFLKKRLKEKFPELIVRRSEPKGGSILDRIIYDITQSDIVIADITDFNPNVLWELGVRNSFKHGTITIAQNGTELPFDLKDIGTYFYDFGEHPFSQEIDDFFEKFDGAVKDCLVNLTRTDSPILEAIPRGTFFELVKRQENLRKIGAIINECNDNISTLEYVFETVQNNQKLLKEGKGDDRIFGTSRTRTSALESLVVNQYLTEDENFYFNAASCLHDLIRLNDQLVSWEYKTIPTENWLIKYLPSSIEDQKTFKAKLVAIQKKI